MGSLPKFNLIFPQNEKELFSFMQKYKGNYILHAGGTDIIPNLKKNLFSSDTLISISQLRNLDFIVYDKKTDELRIGALVSLNAIIDSKLIKKKVPSMIFAAKSVAAPPIRNKATIGGNICLNTRCFFYNQSLLWRKSRENCFKLGGNLCNALKGSKRCFAVFAADMPALLIALESEVLISSVDSVKRINLENFYTGNGIKPNMLNDGEYVKEIIIKDISNKKALYEKFRLRNAIDFPLCGVSAAYNKISGKYRVVLNAVDSKPVLIPDVEKLENCLETCEKYANPVANFNGTPEYRKKLTSILLKKIIERW